MEREREKEGEERERKILLPFFPMNFNAQHWSPSRILGSHLLEKKVVRNAVLCSLLLHGEMFHVGV